MQTTQQPPNHIRFIMLSGMILAAAAFRIIPHPPNFSPIAAIALFGGLLFAEQQNPHLKEVCPA